MIIKALPPKKYIEMFSEHFEMVQKDNFFFAITPNEFDDFRQFSYVNGLNIISGGTHIDYISSEIVNRLRDTLVKKYKTIKPGDIKNKLMVVCVMRDFKDLKFDSQTKEKVTNSITEIKSYFGDIDFDTVCKKILKTPEIIDPITEVYKIKEELKKRQEMKGLEKVVKKIRSEKYTPAIKHKKYLVLVEGASAFGGLSPVLGRSEFGYYELKGKPLNAWEVTQSKFAENEELADLYRIIKQEGYEYILYGTDADLDGSHIRGLLNGFIYKYLPEYKSKLGIFQTPVIAAKKNNKLVSWTYDMTEDFKIPSGCTGKYYKGLGSWLEVDLKEVIAKDGIQNMIEMIEVGDDDIIDLWLNKSRSDDRKIEIMKCDFSIVKL